MSRWILFRAATSGAVLSVIGVLVARAVAPPTTVDGGAQIDAPMIWIFLAGTGVALGVTGPFLRG